MLSPTVTVVFLFAFVVSHFDKAKIKVPLIIFKYPLVYVCMQFFIHLLTVGDILCTVLLLFFLLIFLFITFFFCFLLVQKKKRI